jgi:hypothetical protein
MGYVSEHHVEESGLGCSHLGLDPMHLTFRLFHSTSRFLYDFNPCAYSFAIPIDEYHTILSASPSAHILSRTAIETLRFTSSRIHLRRRHV